MGLKKRGSASVCHSPGTPLFFILLLFATHVLSQNRLPETAISLSSRNRSIHQILDDIAIQTGYHFTYNSALIQGNKRVRFKVSHLLLEEVLDSLLQDTTLDYRVVDRNIVIFQKNRTLPAPISDTVHRALIRGIILESRSGKPLPFATITLFGTSLGTITNHEGRFSFKIPANLADPMLVISNMGYRKLFLPVRYPIRDDLTIHMDKEIIPLQEVIIRYHDPHLLLSEAIGRIPENYPGDHSTMQAFYRESVKRNDHYMVYSEAILDVAKSPYINYTSNDQVRIRKRRKIIDITAGDTVLIKLQSGILTAVNLDIIKNRPDFLSDEFPDLYDLEYTDMMSYGDKLVYVISFNQKSNVPGLLFNGRLYLDYETLAIVAADFEYDPEQIRKEPGLFLVSRSPALHIRPMLARYHVDYRPENGKYYMSQVRAELEMRIRKKRRWIGSRYRITIEMAITELIPGQRLKIHRSERVRSNEILTYEPFGFDPLFWGIHNIIEPEVSLMKAIGKLKQVRKETEE